jgi:predicted Rossmann-fold nucleotide-binding protein
MAHVKRSIAVVFGSNSPKDGEPDYATARELGRLLAQAGYVVATGGYFGTMEAASRGAKEAGGHVIGVTTSVTMADAWVALPGGIGTLSEVALTWSLMQVGEMQRRPFVLVGEQWRKAIGEFSNDYYVRPQYRELLRYAGDVTQVVELLK